MSEALNARRPSISPQRSAASSSTLHSTRSSPIYTLNTQRASTGSPESYRRASRTARDNDRISGSTRVDAYQESDTIGTQDFALKRQKVRRSGGFLLQSPSPRHLVAGLSTRRRAVGNRDEERQSDIDKQERLSLRSTTPTSSHTGNGSIGRSPLSREVLEDRREGSRTPMDTSTYARQDPPRLQGEGEDTTMANHASAVQRSHELASRPANSSIDPAQLVHMALNLSESRRRNVSGSHLMNYSMSQNRRNVSVGTRVPSHGHARHDVISQLQSPEQRRTSRGISPGTLQGEPLLSDHVPARRTFSPYPSALLDGQILEYQFSDATLARSNKARAYIELSVEYRRLLQYLPPLKPDASAPGNSTIMSSSVPDSPSVDLHRVPSGANRKHPLGREYNPLQLIRDRRTRARHRQTLSPEPEAFDDIMEVRQWVDAVELRSTAPGYREEYRVNLPAYGFESPEKSDAEQDSTKPTVMFRRPRLNWQISPTEFLADTYWLERGENKLLIENKWGNTIFSPQADAELNNPRMSKEYMRQLERQESLRDSNRAVSVISDTRTAEDSDAPNERGRKRHSFLPARGEAVVKGKKRRFNPIQNPTRSSSVSSSDDNKSITGVRPKSARLPSSEVNIGPLQRHLRGMIERDEIDETQYSSDDVNTPDKWGFGHVGLGGKTLKSNGEMIPLAHEKSAPRSDANNIQEKSSREPTSSILSVRDTAEPRSSLDDLDSTAPSSPTANQFVPRIGADLSPPDSRRPSATSKLKKHKLSLFRLDTRDRHNDREADDSDLEHRSLKRDSVRGNVISNLEEGGKFVTSNNTLHQKRSSVASIGSQKNEDRFSHERTREPHSAVNRFFKGGRLADLIRNETRRSREYTHRKEGKSENASSTNSSSSSDSSGSEGSGKRNKLKRKFRVTEPMGNTTHTGSISAPKPDKHRFHVDLPTFKPASEQVSSHRADENSAVSIRGRPLEPKFRRAEELRGRSGVDINPHIRNGGALSSSRTENSSRSVSQTRSHSGSRRLTKVLAQPGRAGAGGLPVTGLKRLPSSADRSASRPTLEGHRHWSISNHSRPRHHSDAAPLITPQDIARVRALLLCSGIKARTIARQSVERPDHPYTFLRTDYRAAARGRTLVPVARKDEHALAGRALERDLEDATAALEHDMFAFRDDSLPALLSQLAEVRRVVADVVPPEVARAAQDADAITRELAEKGPLAVQDLVERIDVLVRRRRRRMRWVRRASWALLEWLVLALMWWLWLVVVIWKSVRGTVVFLVGAVRWLFFL